MNLRKGEGRYNAATYGYLGVATFGVLSEDFSCQHPN